MTDQELEELYIRSLDISMSGEEKARFMNELRQNPQFARQLEQHQRVRKLVAPKTSATFGPYFASRVVHKIENTAVIIERQIFSFFKKYQLVAVGVVVALLVLNLMLTDVVSIDSVFSLDHPDSQEEIVSFDFFDTINNNL